METNTSVVPFCAILLGGELEPGEGEEVTDQGQRTDLSMPG